MDRVILPVRNTTLEGFELKEKFVKDLTKQDEKYLEQKAKLQAEPGNEDKLDKLLHDYLDKLPEPEGEDEKDAE